MSAIWTPRTNSVKNTYVKIVNNLPSGLAELYDDIHGHAKSLSIDFLVVGAMARDLIMVHGFGANIERGTRDVDFAIKVEYWDEFNALKDILVNAGYQQDTRKIHQLTYLDTEGLPWEIDIIPFGKIADENNNISWHPKQDLVMNVRGFTEAFEHALNVQINETTGQIVHVASPAGICLLKLISWLDREVEQRSKDAMDFRYLIESYSKIPEINDAIYKDGHMQNQEWDEFKASSMKLGEDVVQIASSDTIDFLKNQLFCDNDRIEQFIQDMQKDSATSFQECENLFAIFAKAFQIIPK